MTIQRRPRRAIATVTLALAAFMLSGCAIISGALNGGKADVFTIKVGDCLNDKAGSTDVKEVPLVDCDKPHDSEVYASIILDDGDYPGKPAVVAEADSSCYAAFETFTGVAWDHSKYNFAPMYPTEESWAVGDREVLCRIVLADKDGTIHQVTGTLKSVGE